MRIFHEGPRLRAAAVLVAAFVLAACGGSEPGSAGGEAGAAATGEPAPAAAPAAATPGGSESAPAEAGGSAAVGDPVPVVRLAAHGPAAATFGPRCGTGIEGTSSGVFRITAPDGWVYRGTGGGSGADHIIFEVRGTRLIVDLYAHREELRIESDFEDRGETGVTVDLGGTTVPLHEVAVEDRTGFGILHVPWLLGLPRRDDPEGTILLTSREPGLIDAEVAAAVLGTVGVERCAAISEALIWGRVAGYEAVPDFEGGDPLGKERPDAPPPAYVPGQSPLLTLSEAQVAYLLPLPAAEAACVAPLVRADASSDPILHLKVLAPTGTYKEDLARYVERCGA